MSHDHWPAVVGENLKSYVTIRKSSINCDGYKVNYLTKGQGTPVVFLHGFSGNKSQWRTLMNRYDHQQYQTMAFDLPGFYFTNESLNRRVGIVELSNWLDSLLNQLGIDQCHLVAHSAAVFIAVEYAATCSDRVLSITMANAPQIILPESAEEGGLIQEFLDMLRFESHQDFYDTYKRLFYNPPAFPTLLMDYHYKRFVKAEDRINKSVRDFLRHRPRILTKLSQVDCPVLAVGGDHDLFGGGQAMMDSLALHLKDVETTILSKCGHMSFIERQKAFLEIHTRFLERLVDFSSLRYSS